MKKRSNLGAVGIEILLVPAVIIVAVLYLSNSKIEPIEPIQHKPVVVDPIDEPIENPTVPKVDGQISERIEDDGKLNIVTSLEDTIDEDTVWCGIFNLVWNDLRDELVKQDIIFAESNETVENLNKGTFTVEHISEDSYYKTYGIPTLELKKQIEKAIKDKFNEKSDILNSFKWDGDINRYFLYGMLKKEFKFPKVFTKLGEDTFGNNQTAKYFGIDGSTEDEVKNQVRVLYYNSENDFAIKLLTKQNDEVILTVGNDKSTFLDIYNFVSEESTLYTGSKHLANRDRVKIPNIKFDLKENITDVENKPFYFSNGIEYVIDKALQTIQFELNEEGGKVKSEVGMSVGVTSVAPVEVSRYFFVDESFTIFLIEEGRELPYFAAKISDIENIQK